MIKPQDDYIIPLLEIHIFCQSTFHMNKKNIDNSYKPVYDVTEIIEQSEEL